MRRQARTLIFIGVLVLLSAMVLGFQTIKVGTFERGSNETPLGLSLGLDLQGGTDLVYRTALTDQDTGEPVLPTEEQMASLKTTLERRINASGLGGATIQILGDNKLLIQIPGVRDSSRIKSLIGETARLEFKHRSLNVRRPIPGVANEDIVGFRVGALVDPNATSTTANGEQSSNTTGSEPDIGGPAASTLAATPAVTTTTNETAAASTAASALAATPAVATTNNETTAASTATSTLAATPSVATTTDENALAPTATGIGPQIEFGAAHASSTPVLVIEFTDAAADEFEKSVQRLKASLEEISGAGTIYPAFLSIGVAGGSFDSYRIPYYPLLLSPDTGQLVPLGGGPYIQRIEGTNRFAINLSVAVPDLATAREKFGGGVKLDLGEVLGKLDEDTGLTGDDLARAYPGQRQGTGLPIVNIEFNSAGTRKFGELTSRIAGTTDQLAILLDGKELIAPTVRQAIVGGAAYIEGRDFTFDRVRDISLLLESGRLPIPIELVRERNVDAILGADSLARSAAAGMVGLALVLLFMFLYYRAAGVVAALALLVFASLFLAILKILPVTLTLSGAAAAVLSIGMAVDANILIFERMKEELRTGRTLLSSINIGFNRAWPAIRDSNVSTLITCAILFWFSDTLGTTIVQGFAITLAIGVVISMFSAITVSRTLLRLAAGTPLSKRLDMFVPAGVADLPQQQPEAATA